MIPEASRSADREEQLLDLVAGYLERLGAGQAEERAALLARHPEFAAELAEFFAMRDRVNGVAVPLRQAVLGDRRPVGMPQGDDNGNTVLRELLAAADKVAEIGRLGDFRILREVGRGGMGIVYEAEQISLRRRVALKVLPCVGVLHPRQLQRFTTEARAAACLHHTNIVPVYAVGSEHGVHYYAMQFIDGQTLAALIRQLRSPADQTPEQETIPSPPPPRPPAAGAQSLTRRLTLSGGGSGRGRDYYRTVAELGVQAAEALDHAHQMGIVHRDVKPGNLMLDADGRLWVTDFGLAHIQHGDASLTLTGELVGTPRYMSPEQALARRVVTDHRIDVYSVGATLYELLTLRPVFDGTDRQELLRQIASEEPRPPRRLERAVPAELEVIVLKALE
jgi:serine/threonine protein kinase